jgi:glycosyltransferase involved in cell wall biosynthesis
VVDGAGVDPGQFFPAATDRKPEAIKVLFASRLLKSKGLDTFLDVARGLAGRRDIEFLAAGMFSSKDPDGFLPSQLQREESIRFLGEVKDMAALLRSCDIICLPTRYGEGIPRILIEAAATGLASIASDVPGCREVVVDGVTGRIVSGSGGDMVQAVQDALLDYVAHPELIRAHGGAAYQLFKSRGFDQDSVALRFQQLLGV